MEAIVESMKAPVEEEGQEKPISPKSRNKNKERKALNISMYNQKQLRGYFKKQDMT